LSFVELWGSRVLKIIYNRKSSLQFPAARLLARFGIITQGLRCFFRAVVIRAGRM